MEQFEVQWVDNHREPQCAPNPDFPDGVDLDFSEGSPACTVQLPYPAKRCGLYVVKCNLCGFSVACTTAGRPDDPKSITIPCNRAKEA